MSTIIHRPFSIKQGRIYSRAAARTGLYSLANKARATGRRHTLYNCLTQWGGNSRASRRTRIESCQYYNVLCVQCIGSASSAHTRVGWGGGLSSLFSLSLVRMDKNRYVWWFIAERPSQSQSRTFSAGLWGGRDSHHHHPKNNNNIILIHFSFD